MGRSTTIVDVAHAAGVSKSTVSNVVRGAEPVSEETRRRVQAEIERLNYKPNGIARQFVKRRTTMVGVLVGDLGNPYHAHLAQAVERALFRRGHTAMFCNVDGDEDTAVAGVEALLEQRVAGFVLMGQVERAAQVAATLRASEAPVVTIGLRQGWSDSVGPRDREGGRLAATHLLGLGHRRIAYLRTSSAEAGGDRARHAGYLAALRAAGVAPLEPIAWEPGSAVPEELLGAGAPTAVVVWNDHAAVALIDACEAAGVAVPGALSVVGFDDIDVARLRRISLTTVAQPLDLQAGRAVEVLLDRLDGDPTGRPRHLSVPVELRVRASTAAATSVRR